MFRIPCRAEKARAFLVAIIIVAVRLGNVYVPIFFKNAVDALAGRLPPTALRNCCLSLSSLCAGDSPYTPIRMILLYGCIRALTTVQRDLRTIVWLPVTPPPSPVACMR